MGEEITTATGWPLIGLIVASIIFVVLACGRWRWHPLLALLLAGLGLGLAVGLPPAAVIDSLKNGFGGILASIGLVVIFGAIIGVALERSGAALRLADMILGLVGPKKPVLAMTLIGAVVSIPVFCDTGFIVLSRLNRSVAGRTGVAQGTLVLGLAGGLYTTHTLIPPTPGPLAAADQLGAVDYLGTIMLIGFLLALPAILVAWYLARRWGPQLDIKDVEQAIQPRPEQGLPSRWASVTPIFLPIVLIAVGTTLRFFNLTEGLYAYLQIITDPTIALLLGVLSCWPLAEGRSWSDLMDWTSAGGRLAGPILILTGAGAAFGAVLKSTELRLTIESWLAGEAPSGLLLLIVSFLVAALLKTAQGSSTNAIQICAALMAGIAIPAGFDKPLELALLIGAIGAGAMTVSHANDSYFWVVTEFGGIDLRKSYTNYTVMTGVQGLVVLLAVLFLYTLLL
ncbi:MAG: GntP family permease [Bacteroidota bacterium]